MKELFIQYAEYTAWANRQLIEIILQLPEEKQQQVLKSSFNSIHNTLLHVLGAENIWWQRFHNNPGIPASDKTNTASVAEALINQNQLMREWMASIPENQFQEILVYKNLKGIEYSEPYYQVLLHLFNHSTYHRGQLVTMLRNLDVAVIPATDFIVWFRLLNKT